MDNWTIRQRLLGSFAVILALMIVMGAVAYTRFATIEKGATSASTRFIPGLYYSTQILGNLIMGYALTVQQIGQDDVLATQTLETRFKANQQSMDDSIRQYEATIDQTATVNRQLFAAFQAQRVPYTRHQQEVLQLSSEMKYAEANKLWREQFDPAFEKVLGAIQAVLDLNKRAADQSVRQIMSAIASARIGMLASFVATLLFTFVCAYYLLQGISRPLAQLMDIVEVMRAGDLSKRLTLHRRDEFHALAEGFKTGCIADLRE